MIFGIDITQLLGGGQPKPDPTPTLDDSTDDLLLMLAVYWDKRYPKKPIDHHKRLLALQRRWLADDEFRQAMVTINETIQACYSNQIKGEA